MRIGFVGCGKLGLMVALTIESRGHEVKGYDINHAVKGYLAKREIPFKEEYSKELLSATRMEMVGLAELCQWADILFMAPQTPHAPQYEGDKPLPKSRCDFDYQYLKACVQDVGKHLIRPTVCVVISTVLPGTIEREVIPLLGENFRLVYEPLFIAMGTVYKDFLNPEFVLVGVRDSEAAVELKNFYTTIHDKPIFLTDIKTAEGIKVFYNTYISCKTVLSNIYGEMAHKLDMNVDDIYQAFTLATDRLLSPKYLKAGMGDGGACHPRDSIALSYVARKHNLSFDFFTSLMTAREQHVRWLADLIISLRGDLPVFILGRSFKPETDIEVGSPSVLLCHILNDLQIPHISSNDLVPLIPGLYFIGTKHSHFVRYHFPEGSVVIDPFRYIPHREGIEVIAIGDGHSGEDVQTRINSLEESKICQ